MKTEEIIVISKNRFLDAQDSYWFCGFQMKDAIESICDGVGSSSSILQRLLAPNTVLGQDITPASNAHDWDYTFPLYFPWISVGEQYRLEADNRFLDNCEKLFKNTPFAEQKLWIVRSIHYPLLRRYGSRAFWNAKISPRDWTVGKIPARCESLETSYSETEKRVILGDSVKYHNDREIYETFRKKMKARI